MDDIFSINLKKKKITRGYRLSPDTHILIGRIKRTLNTDYDDAINRACRFFCDSLEAHIKEKKSQ